MRINIINFALLVILLSGIATADLLISPNPVSVVVRSGESATFNLELRNTFEFDLIDFKFKNLSNFYFPPITLLTNETKTVTINVTGQGVGLNTISAEIEFKYLIDIPEGTKTHEVNITPTGFSPSFLIARRGDTVVWNNRDDITRSVTGATFDYQIAPNQTQMMLLNTVGEISYFDTVLFYGGTITVINETDAEEVNNPDYNKILTVNLEVTLDATYLELLLTKTNFTVQATGSEESVLEIENKGNETAQRIILTAEPSWIDFSENTISIDAGQTDILTYTVKPIIVDAQETNKTHTIKIKAKGSNTEEYVKEISVFVPYEATFDDITTNEGFLAYFARFCEANPNLIVCNNSISQSGEDRIIVVDPQIPINLSASEFLEFLRRQQKIEDAVLRTTNEQKLLKEQLDIQFPEIALMLNELVEKQNEIDTADTAKTRSFWLFVLGLAIILSVVIVGFTIRKYLQKRAIIDGGVIYKQ